jgi:hypothetical protein
MSHLTVQGPASCPDAVLQEGLTPLDMAIKDNAPKEVALQLLLAGASVTAANRVRPPPISSLAGSLCITTADVLQYIPPPAASLYHLCTYYSLQCCTASSVCIYIR